MTNSTEFALIELAAHAAPSEIRRAADACEHTGEQEAAGGAPVTGQDYAEAAVRLRALAVERDPSGITTAYDGEPVRVDESKITDQFAVPCPDDETPGRGAAALFQLAVEKGALIAPDGIDIECYGDDDSDGGGFTLAAFNASDKRRGVTAGWRDLANIAGTDIVDALAFFACELNTALAAHDPAGLVAAGVELSER